MARKLNANDRLSFMRPNAESTKNGTLHWDQKESHNSTKMSQGPTNVSQRISNTNGLSKIDARTYTDVHSRGLTSRIVKYHENNTRLNRSMSLTNLNLRNSPLSVKHTSKQPELPYKAIKPNVSMTHIAPPDKSLFYGNTLSGLLRSNSVLTLQPNDDDLSSENRPIIHPPGTEKEFQPSVLEVLKEISRKRINNEVLPDNDEADTSKKYCSRNDTFFNGIPNDYRLQQMQLPTTSTSYKRQRESNAYYMEQPRTQQQQQTDLPSPEQQSKRRHHSNYNNDITSSLSSSAKSAANKRKLQEHDGYKRQEKLLRYQPDIRLSELSSALNYGNKLPITPLPNTPQTAIQDTPSLPPAVYVQKSISAPVMGKQEHMTKPRITLFNKNYDTEELKHETSKTTTLDKNDNNNDDDDNAYAGIHFVKPKKSTTSLGSSASSLVLKRTQKSKLALMLSGLRGELYLGEEEEEKKLNEVKNNESKIVSIPTKAAVTISTPSVSNINKTDAAKESITKTIEQPKTSTTTITTSSISNASNIITTTPTTPTATIKPTTKITSPLMGIKLTPMTTTTATTTTTITQNTTQSQPTLNFTAPTSSSSNLQGATVSTASFSFGLPKPSTSSTSTTSTTTLSLPSFGVSSTVAASTTLTTATTTSTASGIANAAPTLNFNFGNTQTQSQVTSTTTTTTTATPAFGIPPSSQAVTATPTFNFGTNSQTSNTGGTVNTFPNNNNTTNNTTPFAFGAPTANKPTENANTEVAKPATNATPSFNFGANKSAGGFSFGNTPKTTANETANANTFTTPKTTNAAGGGGFTFAANLEAAKANNSISLMTFGSPSAPLKFGEQPQSQPQQQHQQQQPENKNTTNLMFGAKPTTSNPTFGTPLANNNNQSGGLFNLTPNTAATTTSNEVVKASNTFNFGNTTTTQPKTFNFGAVAAAPNTETSKTSKNLFGAANTEAPKTTTNLFGATNTETPKTAANLFGGAVANNQNQAFSFGGMANTNTANSTTTPNKPAFQFGNTNTTTNTATNMETPKPTTFIFSTGNQNQNNTFGATNTTNNTTQNNAFVFGGGAPNKPATNEQPSAANIFGGGPPKTNSTFNFGSNTNQAATNNNNTFGAIAETASAPAANGVFNFGGSNAASINKPATTALEQTTNKPALGGFGSFGGSNNSTPTFGAPANSAAPSGGFVFGASSANNSNAAPSGNIFASPNQTNSTGNLFGGATNTQVQAPSNAFVFGAGTAANVSNGSTPAPASNTNLFSVQPNPGNDRPIRRATRRLAKS